MSSLWVLLVLSLKRSNREIGREDYRGERNVEGNVDGEEEYRMKENIYGVVPFVIILASGLY